MPGAADSNGIWQYATDGSDSAKPLASALNLLAASVSTAVGQLKSRMTARETAAALTSSGSPFTAATGWTIVAQSGRKINGVAYVYLRVSSTAAVTVPSNAAIDVVAATFAAGWTPASGIYPAASAARVCTGYVSSAGMRLHSVVPSTTIAAGNEFILTAVYPLA